MTDRPPSLPLVIDSYQLADADAIFSLLEQLWPNKKLDDSAIHILLNDALNSSSRVLVCARLKAKVVGFGCMGIKSSLWHGGNIGWVDELIVDAAYRGRGIGSSVLDHLISSAKAQRCVAVELDSAFHRTEAHKFYETLGFSSRAFVFSKRL